MRVRNLLIRPSFIMYYLTFLVPEATKMLEANGFDVKVTEVRFAWPFRALVLLDARRK